jgi:hypothetical protein
MSAVLGVINDVLADDAVASDRISERLPEIRVVWRSADLKNCGG